MLNIDHVHVAYGKSQIVNGVSFQINKGDKICLMGRNGVGKTTLLKSLIGILPIVEGKVLFEGTDITRMKASQRSRMGMAYVPQGKDILPDFTVLDNLKLGILAHRPKAFHSKLEEILEFFPALKPHLLRKGGVLSGGQQQQLAIGRALMSEPKIIFLDEPSEGIQPNVVAEISHILNRIHREKNITIIIVEQNLEFSFKIADDFYIIEKGKVVSSGRTNEVSMDSLRKYLTI